MEGFIVYGFACCRAPPYALFSPPPACLSYIQIVTGSWFLSYPAGYLGIYVLTPNSQVYGRTNQCTYHISEMALYISL